MSAFRNIKTVLLVVLAGTAALGVWAYLRPLPDIRPTVLNKNFPSEEKSGLPWPVYGQSAVGAKDYGVLETNGDQKPVPIASIAKIITALAVLERKPLGSEQTGPNLSLGPSDVQLFEDYFIRGGSVVKVQNGGNLSEYQALQGLLIPSGNNIADSLAVWAFGSMDNYTKYANQMVKQYGLENTRVADASGFSAGTVSTASDLVELGERALAHPVIADIVAQEKATLPVAGEVNNVNWLLGEEGVIGIKTGSTDEAKGCFMFAANRRIEDKDVLLIGAVLGAPSRDTAITDSRSIIQNVDKAFSARNFVRAGEPLGQYKAPWGPVILAVAKDDLSALSWKGGLIESDTQLTPAEPEAQKNTTVGTITVLVGKKKTEKNVVLAEEMPGPSWRWRLFR